MVMPALEPAVVGAVNFCVSMQFSFAALFPAFSRAAERTFQLDPIDPDRRWMSVAVFCFPIVVRIPKCFEVSVVRLFFLNCKFRNRIGSDLDRNLDRFWVVDGAANLMGTDSSAFESPVSTFNLALRMSHLDKTSLGRSTFNRPDSDAQGIAAGWQFLFLLRNDDSPGAVSQL